MFVDVEEVDVSFDELEIFLLISSVIPEENISLFDSFYEEYEYKKMLIKLK